MAEYIPPTNFEIKWFGDYYHQIHVEDKPLLWVYSFLKTDKTITAKKLGLYFLRHEGEPIQVITDIVIAESEFWEPSPHLNPVLVASDVDLSTILVPPEGWKSIDINPFTFEGGKIYVVAFNIKNVPLITNKQTDASVVMTTERIPDVPIPPDYPYPDQTAQAMDAYGFDRPEMGHFTYVPIAIAVTEGELPSPPPTKMKIPVLPLFLIGGGLVFIYLNSIK